MDVKYNKSTELRPEGGRLMDAPVVPIDIPDFLNQIKNEPAWQDSDRNAMAVYKTYGMRIVLIALHKDSVMEKHTTNGVVSVQVLDGEIKFDTEGKSYNLKKGQLITLHRNIAHTVSATEESVFLLTVADFINE
jgi:quercetin dioxygenase-like cupin family protein